MPVLATNANHITDQLNLFKSQPPSEFEVRLLRKSIEQLKAIDAIKSHMLNGILYALEGKASQAIEYHDKSIRSAPNESILHYNYATSMWHLGLFQKAFEVAHKAFLLEPSSIEIFKNLLSTIAFSGNYEYTSEVIERFNKANPDIEPLELAETKLILLNQEHIKQANLSHSDAKQAQILIEAVLCEHHKLDPQFRTQISTFADTKQLYIEIAIEASADELFKINNDFLDLILENGNDALHKSLTVNFTTTA